MPRPRSPKLDLSRATVSALKKMQKDQPLTDIFDMLEEDAYLQFMPSVLLGVVALVVLAALMTVCCSLGFDRKPTKHAGEKGKTASGGATGVLSAAVRNAAIAGRPDAVLDFLNKTSANARDDGGATLLHHCATHGHAELVRAALAHGGDANAVDASLRTGLHLAARGGHGALVKLLLDAGADAAMVDGQGESAQALAEGAKNQGCALLIKRRLKVAAAGSASSASSPGLSLRHERTADGVPPV